MRTLLVDNFDSFTYNLFHLISVATSVDPTVVTNDDAAALDLSFYDGVVISPGPGHPMNPQDLGYSRAILQESTIPVLGVCLGHEALVCASGGLIDAAPEPRHGFVDRIQHTGTGLFRGIPQDFPAVRYHSLCAIEPVPAELEVTARSSDGVVMGLAHRTKPYWGVQFHPESVSTEYGEQLIRNFASLSTNHAQKRERIVINEPLTSAPKLKRLQVGVIDFAVDTEQAFDVLYRQSDNAFWLDSEHVEPGLDRFSFLGDASGPQSEVVSYRIGDEGVRVRRENAETVVPQDIFTYLDSQLKQLRCEPSLLPFDFTCGYVGYFGYELKHLCGSPSVHHSPTPDATWILADRLIAVDHVEDRTYVIALEHESSAVWIEQTIEILHQLPRWSTPPQLDRSLDPELVHGLLQRDQAQYSKDIDRCQELLHLGESYEICLTNSTAVPSAESGLEVYRVLRRCNPAPYAAYLRFGDVEVACSSPERFLKLNPAGLVESKPIKGTAPRSADPVEDLRLRDEMATDPKTRAENLMIVDLLRNDLGRVSQVGSVHVPKLMATESYTTVHQLVSTVRGTVRAGVSAIDCVRACFPGGSMTGTPKLRTMQFIDEMEGQARGIYSGTIGFLGFNGAADLNIVIRTAVRANDSWTIGSGGAIVLDSQAEEEYREMVLKSVAVLRAFDLD